MPKRLVRAMDVAPVSKGEGRLSRALITPKSGGPAAFALGLHTNVPGALGATHVHEGSSETMYMLQGKIKFTVEGEECICEPDMVLHVPAGVPHGYENVGDVEARFVWVFQPPLPEQR